MNKLHLKFVFILSGMSNLPLELRMRSNKVQPSNTHINLNCHVWPKKGIDTGQCWKPNQASISPLLDLADKRETADELQLQYDRVLQAQSFESIRKLLSGRAFAGGNPAACQRNESSLFHNCSKLWATIAGYSPTSGHCGGQARLWVGKQVAGVVLVVNEFYFLGRSKFVFAHCSFQIISRVHGVRSDSISFKWSW